MSPDVWALREPGLRWMLDAQERAKQGTSRKALLIIPGPSITGTACLLFHLLELQLSFSSQQPGAFQGLCWCIEWSLKPNRMIFLIYLSQKWCSRSLATSIAWPGTWTANGYMARWETQQIISPAHRRPSEVTTNRFIFLSSPFLE